MDSRDLVSCDGLCIASSGIAIPMVVHSCVYAVNSLVLGSIDVRNTLQPAAAFSRLQ